MPFYDLIPLWKRKTGFKRHSVRFRAVFRIGSAIPGNAVFPYKVIFCVLRLFPALLSICAVSAVSGIVAHSVRNHGILGGFGRSVSAVGTEKRWFYYVNMAHSNCTCFSNNSYCFGSSGNSVAPDYVNQPASGIQGEIHFRLAAL